ncbi:MAG: hypothetical protein IPK26_10625 [Planctomycetes bacterium]|nr:hypothetical protein [Planctomycetota bacterium]
MIDAEVLMTRRQLDDATVDVEVFGVWVPRRGDNLRCTVEVVAAYGAELTVELLQKGMDQVGDGAPFSPTTTLVFSGVGRQTAEWSGLMEVVRFRLSLARSDTLSEGLRGWVVFRFQEPVWFESVRS